MYSRALRSFALPRRQFLAARQFQTSSRLCASKDAQGKDDLKPEPNEMSKSGSDDQAAAVEDAAFNPKKTSPEDEYNTAGGESEKHGVSGASQKKKMNNPLDVSPANHEVSKPRSGTEGGHEGSSAQAGDANSQRARTSGGGSSPKKGGGQYGGGGGS
ncbi:hypothetical protein KC333_g5015 [Hortaea werneckii]|nr:hypothetical protein KC333_g5015 [Hortaea werneckii]KAI7314403.1 hypothetical protein KC326_g5036 [Hortaea werneckii]